MRAPKLNQANLTYRTCYTWTIDGVRAIPWCDMQRQWCQSCPRTSAHTQMAQSQQPSHNIPNSVTTTPQHDLTKHSITNQRSPGPGLGSQPRQLRSQAKSCDKPYHAAWLGSTKKAQIGPAWGLRPALVQHQQWRTIKNERCNEHSVPQSKNVSKQMCQLSTRLVSACCPSA